MGGQAAVVEQKHQSFAIPAQSRTRTRISLEAVKRILECIEPLKMYFGTIENTSNDVAPVKGILEVLTKASTEAYLN